MACTSQSALNYVKSARRHLVRELQNLSVILENLNQKRFLSDEDVRNIQAEGDDYDRTRKILDSVMIKGEAACYELLRIIDVTRNRTLERPAPVPEKNTGASTGTQKFDLHHWISCFSFNEDTQMDVDYLQGPRPCHRYQKKLKFKAQKLSQEFWNASKNLFEENRRPDLSYTSLVLDTQKSTSLSKIKKVKKKKGKMSRHKKLRTYIPEDKPKISPTDLLKTQENILLVGKPGIGKTAVVCEMLRLWAEKDNKELDYMFYFDMREMSQTTQTMSLKDLLFNAFSEPDGGVDEVLQDIKSNSDNVTIIFDGVTDLSPSVVRKLVEKELLPDAKIIITCRPDDEEDFFSENCLRVEVKGFSEQTIKSYLSAMLSDTQKVLSSLELLTLCHVPMYALMVAACSSSEDSPQPCTITEIYIDIVRYCLQINSNKTNSKDLNSINTKREEILSLAEKAFHATQGKTVNLTEVPCKDSCVLSFLKTLFINEKETRHAFLHYTLQEFFAAVWLLKNPDKIRNVFQQSLTEEMKHMKHLIPFMCRLLNKKSPSWMKCLIPAEELNSTSKWFFKELITTFIPDVDILFLCQCLYESQSPEACIYLLDKLDYRLELCGESLDPYPCCAVAYVVNQSKERKIRLNLDDDVTISEKGMRQLFGCLQNVQWCDLLPQQLWKIFLLSEEQMDFVSLLGLDDNQLHLPVEGKKQLFERAVEVMKRMTTKVNVCLYWDRETPVCQSRCESLIEALPYISSLRVQWWKFGLDETTRLFVNLFCAAAEREQQTGEKILELLSSVCRYQTFPFNHIDDNHQSDFLLDLFSHVKDCETKTGLRVLPSLQSVFQSAPAVWSINLSERKTSILLEVLKLQSEKKPVELTGWSHEESEVRSFLQCLPYISQLKLSEDHVQQLLVLVHEVQDQDLTLSLLNALSGDLTSCSLNWELLHYLLQQCPAQTITVNLRKNRFLQESTARLLPFLGRIVIKRPSPSLVMTSIRELYRAHASHMVPSLLRSLDHVINLSCRELDSVDFAALLFTLRHSDRVKLNLRWASIPAEGTQSILSTLDRVSQLSVDRNQLLRFIHCCAASDAQQEAASGLLRTLQHRLDLSCQSCVDLQEEDQTEPLSLTADDCRAASMVLKHCSRDTQLHLQDCEVEDGGLDLLFSVLDRVRLRVSKSVLLQLLSLLPVHSERDTVRRAESLCGALGGELDLSHSTLDQRVCGGLVQMLDSCEGLTELDLSHCQLSDQLLLPLITHLHKVQVLDLRYNQITDASTDVLLQLISIHSSIHTVRLFSNDIVDRRPFEKHKQFEMW
ncbi:protein NLRC5-like isoform X7 [Acanthochromis polyacanthus]|uniref:protein NLRC5-like isoform X7 n=1 Tax=Acanthochromis polyacanthus TaxID=80966 RepID=UPI002234CDE8|nr:protein NLRC5-like isoform X7 [Acanthochromis polyacanthus]